MSVYSLLNPSIFFFFEGPGRILTHFIDDPYRKGETIEKFRIITNLSSYFVPYFHWFRSPGEPIPPSSNEIPITQVNQSHRSIAIKLQPGVLPSISWRFSHDEKISLDPHRSVISIIGKISLTFQTFCVAILEPKICFSFIISDPDYEKVCYSWTMVFIG